MKTTLATLGIISVMVLGGCQATTGNSLVPQQSNMYSKIGATGGAIAGGLIATNACGDYICQGLGIMVGMASGYVLGDTIDKVNYMYKEMAKVQAAATMTPTNWVAPGSNYSGTINPIMQKGNCVWFQDGEKYKGKFVASTGGRACQQSDGTWKVMPK